MRGHPGAAKRDLEKLEVGAELTGREDMLQYDTCRRAADFFEKEVEVQSGNFVEAIAVWRGVHQWRPPNLPIPTT